MNLKYFFGVLFSAPLLPLMYYHGRKIRENVPVLPEAQGTEGSCVAENAVRKIKLIALGESTIAGVGVETHEEGFTGPFAKEICRLFKISTEWKVYARSGYTAESVNRKLLPKITEEEADLILIGLGANDAFRLNRPGKWRSSVEVLCDNLLRKFPGAVIIFCDMPPIKEFPAFSQVIRFTVGNLVEILGDELEKVAGVHSRVFYFGEKIRFKKWSEKFGLKNDKNEFFSDGVHPSKLTYQLWAKDWAERVFGDEKLRAIFEKNI